MFCKLLLFSLHAISIHKIYLYLINNVNYSDSLNEENLFTIPEHIIKEVACEHSTKKKEGFNLNAVLNSCRTGQAILALYSCKEDLDSACQAYLIDIIVQHFLNIEPFRYIFGLYIFGILRYCRIFLKFSFIVYLEGV